MKFKTFCACLALVMYAGIVSAMDSGSSHNNDGKNANVETAREMTWKEFLRESPKGKVRITDSLLMVRSEEFAFINKDLYFPNLRDLYIAGEHKELSSDQKNSLSYLLSKSTNLNSLQMQRLRLMEFLREIFNLKGLTKLGYYNNELTDLNLSQNELTELPKEIGNLTNLKYLDLSHNKLTKLPKEIGNLINLKKLFLLFNKLTKLPKEIGNLTNLIDLDLSYNKLTELPKEIGNLTNLKHLNLSHNKLTKLPKEIGDLKNLIELNLSQNELTELPKEIGNLTNLRYLDLSHNKLTKLPKEIGNLINLERLDLTNINSEEIKIIENKNNSVIDLSKQNLLHVPFDIVNCQNSEELDLSNNNLEDLPALMVQLKKLKKIDLRGNPKINSIDKVHDAIFGLPKLESIKLTKNNEDVEYTKEEIAKIRKERIKGLVKKIRGVDEDLNNVTVRYLTDYKNKRGLGEKEMQEYKEEQEKSKANLSAKKPFLKELLSKLKKAEE